MSMIDYPHHPPLHHNKSPCSVFVGDLSFFCQEVDLYQLFRPYGDILRVTIVRGKNERSRKSCFYGFVDFCLSQSAQRAILALNGQLFMGRHIVVNSTETVAPKKNYRHWHKIAINYFAIGDRLVNEQCLRDIFMEFGPLPDVVVRDYCVQRNMHFQTFAYPVEAMGLALLYFADGDAAMRAIAAINDANYSNRLHSYSFGTNEVLPSPLSRYDWIHFILLDPDDPRLKEGDSIALPRRTAPSLHHRQDYFRQSTSHRPHQYPYAPHQQYEHQAYPYVPNPSERYRSEYQQDFSSSLDYGPLSSISSMPSYSDSNDIHYPRMTDYHHSKPVFPHQSHAPLSEERGHNTVPHRKQISALEHSAAAGNLPYRFDYSMDIPPLSTSQSFPQHPSPQSYSHYSQHHLPHQHEPVSMNLDYFSATSTDDIPGYVPRMWPQDEKNSYLPNFHAEELLPPLKQEERKHSSDEDEAPQYPCNNTSKESIKVSTMDAVIASDKPEEDELLSLSTDVWLASLSDSSSASASTSFAIHTSNPASDERLEKDISSLAINGSGSSSVDTSLIPFQQDSMDNQNSLIILSPPVELLAFEMITKQKDETLNASKIVENSIDDLSSDSITPSEESLKEEL